LNQLKPWRGEVLIIFSYQNLNFCFTLIRRFEPVQGATQSEHLERIDMMASFRLDRPRVCLAFALERLPEIIS
jgi:hypothetical protein